jgi:hypothetical protein
MSRYSFVGRALLILKMLIIRPPGMYKAVSGMKKSPSDQGELSGILQKLGYDKDQVRFLKMSLIVGLQVLNLLVGYR